MVLTTEELEYMSQILRFTERQIQVRTGHEVKLQLSQFKGAKEGIDDPEEFMHHILSKVNTPLLSIKSGGRDRELVAVRQVLCMLLKKYFPQLTLQRIAGMIQKDHTTIMYYLNACKNNLDTNDEAIMLVYSKMFRAAEDWLKQKTTEA